MKEELIEMIRQVIREELGRTEKIRRITKKEACEELHINFRTLVKIMGKLGISQLHNTDIEKLRNYGRT